MPTYRYQGHKIGGGATTGSIEAPTAELAAEALMGRGIMPTSIEAGHTFLIKRCATTARTALATR